MSQPNPQKPDNNDEYALPVGTERLPDIVSEMNEERGIKTVVNYDADIPEDMKLQTDEPRHEMQDKTDKDDGSDESDETIIYDASEFDDANKTTPKLDNTYTDEDEKALKGQLRTQTYGIIRQKPTNKRTYTSIDCGPKGKANRKLTDTIGKNIVQLNARTVTKYFQHLIPYNDTDMCTQLETSLCVTSAARITLSKAT